MNMLTTINTSDAPAPDHSDLSTTPSIADNESEPAPPARTISESRNAASARQANVASRAAPMPSNADPVSSAASTVKKRPSANRYTRNKRSPVNAIGAG